MKQDSRPIVIAIVGPTASGKTDLSLAIADKLNAEIVACDSRTVYRYMDIGTAKPSADEQKRVRHFMLDVVNPDQTYTVSDYKKDAAIAIEDIVSRKHLPIVCGGTGFYARALLQGMSMPDVSPDQALREQFTDFANVRGNSALHGKLEEVDPKTAAKVNVNDRFRIIRALEVFHIAGKPMSELVGQEEPPYRTIWVGVCPNDRNILRQAIAQRMEKLLEQGLINEVDTLLKKYGACQTLTNTVNYKEFLAYLAGTTTLEQATYDCIIASSQLARRQLIWYRANREITWFASDELDKAALQKAALEHIQNTIESLDKTPR
jgi:tRNA dimethylallyltransferase